MNSSPDIPAAAIWHDAECGAYEEDLPLWRALADACGGPVLDIGAGTGRVTLDLAGHGHELTALDIDQDLLDVLSGRAHDRGLQVRTLCADARDLEFAAPAGGFSLAIVPMQTVQLFGGPAGRRRFIRSLRPMISPGGLVAIAIADALSAFDSEDDGLPPADELTVGGLVHRSQTVAITDEGDRATIHRVRTIGDAETGYDRTTLDVLDAGTLETELSLGGFRRRARRAVDETSDYLGSTVVVAGA